MVYFYTLLLAIFYYLYRVIARVYALGVSYIQLIKTCVLHMVKNNLANFQSLPY